MPRKIQQLIRSNGVASSIACIIDKCDLEANNLQVGYSLRNEDGEQIEYSILTLGEEIATTAAINKEAIWNAVAAKLGATFI